MYCRSGAGLPPLGQQGPDWREPTPPPSLLRTGRGTLSQAVAQLAAGTPAVPPSSERAQAGACERPRARAPAQAGPLPHSRLAPRAFPVSPSPRLWEGATPPGPASRPTPLPRSRSRGRPAARARSWLLANGAPTGKRGGKTRARHARAVEGQGRSGCGARRPSCGGGATRARARSRDPARPRRRRHRSAPSLRMRPAPEPKTYFLTLNAQCVGPFDTKLRACTVQCCNPKATSTTTTKVLPYYGAARARGGRVGARTCIFFWVRARLRAGGRLRWAASALSHHSVSQSASGAAAAARDGDGRMEDGRPGHPPDNDDRVHQSKPKRAPTTACQQHQRARRGANHGGDALGWIRALARGGRRGARRRARGPGGRSGKPARRSRPPLRPPLSGRPAESSREIASEKSKEKSPPAEVRGACMHRSFSRRTRARRRGAQPTRRAPGGGGRGGGAARREEGRGKKGAGGGGRSPWPERACGLGASRLLARVLIRRGGRPVCRWPVCLRGAHHARAGRRGAE